MKHLFSPYLIPIAGLLIQSELGLSQTTNDWSQWRGPTRDGKLASSSEPWPDSISDNHLVKIWNHPLSEGYSSPVTSEGQVFTVETRSEKTEITRSLDVTTGQLNWLHKWPGAMKVPFFAKKQGSWVRSTPATDNKSLFVAGMRDVLVSIDNKTGEENWRIDFSKRESTDLPAFGYVSSPLIDGEHLYVQAGMAVNKINKVTGNTIWRSLEDRRAMFGSAFSSPVIAKIQGKRQLIVQTRMNLVGLDLENGSELWSTPVKAFRGMNIVTPTVIGNQIFTATYGGGCFYFDIQKDNGKFSVRTIWKNEKIEGYMSSPIAIDGFAYLHSKDGKFYCIDLKTGQAKWASEEKFGKYWSMIANGGKILALDQNGTLLLIKASPEKLNILDQRKISDEQSWAHVAIDGKLIFVRGLKSLVAYKWN